MFLLILFTLNLIHCAISDFPQCLQQVCQSPEDSIDPKHFYACEPLSNQRIRNVASIARIKIAPDDATCGTPPINICSLQNPTACTHICYPDVHNPTKMIDGVKWTWWQSTPTRDLTSKFSQINITFSLPKVFILTRNIEIKFYDGYPDAMVVEKSSNRGLTWTVMEYFSSNCLDQFQMKKTNHAKFLNLSSVFQPICTEKYSVNKDGISSDGVCRVQISERINSFVSLQEITQNETCAMLYSDSALKRFLEITDLRIRLIRPPRLTGIDENFEKYQKNQSIGYGITSVHISARCQCNGHAGECVNGKGEELTLKCKCEHNTYGSECQKCNPLFWMTKWKPATVYSTGSNPNPCLSFYSWHYRKKCLKKDPFNNKNLLRRDRVPKKCECNGHSNRCEYINEKSGSKCVNCRHNTEGQNCHRCRFSYYRAFNKTTTDPRSCKACACDRQGSLGSWCEINGRCKCKLQYKGKKCDRCATGFYKNGSICQSMKEGCCLIYCKEQCNKSNAKIQEKEISSTIVPNPLLFCKNIIAANCSCNLTESQICLFEKDNLASPIIESYFLKLICLLFHFVVYFANHFVT